MKKIVFIALYLVCLTASAQSTFTSVTGDVSWRNNASWTGTATFPAHNPISNDNYTIPVNSIVRLGSTSDPQTLTASNASSGRTFTINGTLIIYGNVDFSNQASDIVLGNGALLIVFGSITVNNKMDISTTGSIVATGGFTKTGSESQGSYTGGGNVYASPINVPGTWVPPADQKNNTTDLSNDLPNIYNFITCGGGPSCSLPVKLAYFNGQVHDSNFVKLEWATTFEENFSRFVVQRSSDGVEFIDLGEIRAKGFNKKQILTKYAFEDREPNVGFNYYRLKAIDIDEYTEIFDPIAVRFAGAPKVTIYPNPSNGERLELTVNFNPTDGDRIQILNRTGVQVLNLPVSKSITSLTFNHRLAPGLYIVRYISGTETKTSRLIVH